MANVVAELVRDYFKDTVKWALPLVGAALLALAGRLVADWTWPVAAVMGVLMLGGLLLIVASMLAILRHFGIGERKPKSPYPVWPEPYNPIVVSGKTFRNERVLLDGHTYRNCTFENVTFVYNGTTNLDFQQNKLRAPIVIDSDNLAVKGTVMLLGGLGCLSPMLTLELPPSSIVNPIKIITPAPSKDNA